VVPAERGLARQEFGDGCAEAASVVGVDFGELPDGIGHRLGVVVGFTVRCPGSRRTGKSSVAFSGGSPCWGRPDDRFSRTALGYADAAQRGEHRGSTDCTRRRCEGTVASAYLKEAAPIRERSSSDHGRVEERD